MKHIPDKDEVGRSNRLGPISENTPAVQQDQQETKVSADSLLHEANATNGDERHQANTKRGVVGGVTDHGGAVELMHAGNGYGFYGPEHVKLVDFVTQIKQAISVANPSLMLTSEFLAGALRTLTTACDTFLGWHREVDSPIDVQVGFESGGIGIRVLGPDRQRSRFVLSGERWRRGDGPCCSMLDVSLSLGQPIAYVEGLVRGMEAIGDTVRETKRKSAVDPEFVDPDYAAKMLGVPRSLIDAWVDSQFLLFYRLPGSDTPWFRPTELKRWAKDCVTRHGGLDVPPRVEVTVPELGEPDVLSAIPHPIRSISGLRHLSFGERLSGIYFLCHAGEVVYVGQSVNSIGRVASHQNEGVKTFDRAYVLPCRSDHLDQLERELIDKLMPKYNADSKTKSNRRQMECAAPQSKVSA